jgi:excisionase family DNA binding protein
MILLTEPQAALRLRVQVATLRRLHEDHGLPGGVVAGEWRISASDLDRWARDRIWHHPRPPIRARDLVADRRKGAQVAENAPEGYYALRRAVQQAIEAARAQIDEDGRPRGLNP